MTRQRLLPLALAATALIGFTACSGDSSTGSDSTTRSTTATPSTSPGTTSEPGSTGRPQGFASRLEFFGDCPALLDYMQTEATARVTAWGLGGGMYYAEGDVAVAESADAMPREKALRHRHQAAGGDFSGHQHPGDRRRRG